MKQYRVQDYYKAIQDFAPFSLAESWDNPGLLVGSGDQIVVRALLALDATLSVVAEAKELGAQLIVTHHPVIFTGIKSIPGDSVIYKAIQAGQAIICAHTNFDIAQGGVNDVLADILELRGASVLDCTYAVPYRKVIVFVPRETLDRVYDAMTAAGAGRQGRYSGAAFLSSGEGRFVPLEGANPAIGSIGRMERVEEVRLELLVKPSDLDAVLAAMRSAHPYEEPAYDVLETQFASESGGLGRVGDTSRSFEPCEFAAFVREKLGAGGVKFVPGNERITRVAVCGGAGAQFLQKAKNMGAQALVSAECKHHQLLEAADMGMTFIDAGHYSTEAAAMPVLMERLKAALPGADIRIAAACADPARYITAQ